MRILITGYRGGIGQALMHAFSSPNNELIGVDMDNLDITDTPLVSEFVTRNNFDVIINNAGITRDNNIEKMDEEDFDKVLSVNLKAAWVISKAAIPYMKEEGWGRIINISSVNAWGCYGQTNYAASKAGLLGMSKSLALEYAKKGITVNCICPGYARTPMLESIKPEIMIKILAKIPIGRLIEPSSIAETAVFLTSDAGADITGTEIHISGGMHL